MAQSMCQQIWSDKKVEGVPGRPGVIQGDVARVDN